MGFMTKNTIMGKKELAIDKFHVIKTVATNGVSYKYDNRRVKVFNADNKTVIQFKKLVDKDFLITQPIEVNGRVCTVTFSLTPEATEILLFALADVVGVRIVDK